MSSFLKLFPSPPFTDVLVFFFTHPNEEAYQSQIVHFTGRALIQIQRALKRLEDTGLIVKNKQGNRIYYKAKQLHPAFDDIKKALFKTVIFGDTLKAALAPIKHKILFSFIYGSMARAEESPTSDIDLFIVGHLGIKDMASILGSLGNELGREINPTVYPLKELKKKLKEQNPFISAIIRGPKIWLVGDENELAKMV